MTQSRKTEIRTLAEQYVGKNRSAKIILECLDAIDELQRLYGIALDYAYSSFRKKNVALSKLKALAEKCDMAKFRVLRPAHKCQTPIEALQLAEDVQRIEIMLDCLKRIQPESVGDKASREDGQKQLWVGRELFRVWHRRAQERLRKEFLSVQK